MSDVTGSVDAAVLRAVSYCLHSGRGHQVHQSVGVTVTNRAIELFGLLEVREIEGIESAAVCH